MDIEPNETRGFVWRLKIPRLEDTFEEGTLFIKLSVSEEVYIFKFILQSLSNTTNITS